MKTSLYLTLTDHFRSPDVLRRARECRDAGWKVIWLTRDEQPLYAPETKLSGWPKLAGCRPDLVILDNLYFDDRRGAVITHLQQEKPGGVWRSELEKLLGKLEAAGTREVILVCEQERVTTAWQDILNRLRIPLLKTESVRCRDWRLTDAHGNPYAFEEDRLEEPADDARTIRTQFRNPESEVLLTVASEYIQIQHEYDNPEDPHEENKHWHSLVKIIESLDESEQYELLDDLGALYDRIEDVYNRTRPDSKSG